jgi:hypothetical protein
LWRERWRECRNTKSRPRPGPGRSFGCPAGWTWPWSAPRCGVRKQLSKSLERGVVFGAIATLPAHT